MESDSEDQRPHWKDLSRQHQRLLERLWGGGTLRGQDEAVAIGLQRMGYLQGDKITPAGITLCEEAFRAMMNRMPTRRSDPAHQQSSAERTSGNENPSEDAVSDLETLATIARGDSP